LQKENLFSFGILFDMSTSFLRLLICLTIHMEIEGVVFFIFLGLAIMFFTGLLIYKLLKKRNLLKVMMVRDKFTPMAGKFFLFVDKSTGMVRIDKTGDRCMFFDTEAEAVFILDQFQDQKDKPES